MMATLAFNKDKNMNKMNKLTAVIDEINYWLFQN